MYKNALGVKRMSENTLQEPQKTSETTKDTAMPLNQIIGVKLLFSSIHTKSSMVKIMIKFLNRFIYLGFDIINLEDVCSIKKGVFQFLYNRADAILEALYNRNALNKSGYNPQNHIVDKKLPMHNHN